MNRRSYILTVIFVLFFVRTYAHQDFWKSKDYGNIKVRIKTGFDYEEINKSFIIGQLAEKLSKELNYLEPIFLDFNHHYTGNCEPDYFVSYDKGSIQYTWTDNREKAFLNKNAIVIRQVSRQFSASATLKLLEYAIQNLSEIKSSQKEIEYIQNYCQWRINSIDTTYVKNIIKRDKTVLLNNILDNKIERPEENFKYGVSYYWHKDKYHIFTRDYNTADLDVIELENIYAFDRISKTSCVVFDSDTTFYYSNSYKNQKISKRHEIKNTFGYYRPFKVADIGGEKLSIYFYNLEEGPRTLVYQSNKDLLIQDLDKLINKD